MGSYIAEKNGGSAKASYDKNGYTSSVTISMNDKTKTYTVASGDVEVIHGKAIIDNELLMNDFDLSEEQSLHNEGDVFHNVDDVALAFGLMYYDTSKEEKQEYGAAIDTTSGGYCFTNVTKSTDNVPATFGDPNELSYTQRNTVNINRTKNTVATIHTHWKESGNLNLSNPKDYEEPENVNTIFLVNRNFQFIKSVRYTGPNNINGFSEGIIVF